MTGYGVAATTTGVRVSGLGEATLDPAEARRLAAELGSAADEADILASQLLPLPGCTAHLDPLEDGRVLLHATHATGHGRWLSAPHPLDGTTYPTAAQALSAAIEAGLCQDAPGAQLDQP